MKENERSSLNKQEVGAVLVVGGGIGGIQASLDLANSGFKVYLLEESPAIGGRMAQLDKTFPTNDCSMCIISPKLVEVGSHMNIELLTYADVLNVEGEPGKFKVDVKKRARSVSIENCTGCGECYQKCPTKTKSEFDEGVGMRKAIYVPFPQAIPNVPAIDREHCRFFTTGKCQVCQKVCPAGAIDYEQKDEVIDIEVGSIILAPGFETFDPHIRGEYGYGRFKNVVTSLEFERILSASGPMEGHVRRPSDQTEPRKIAWIQCVGSRDLSCESGYCSSVCCMYATKEAIIAKEHLNDIEPTIFFMDIRAFGKGFEAYYERAEKEHGVRYVRCMISRVVELPKTKHLFITYINEIGETIEEVFDLVVLSVGIKVTEKTQELGKRLGVDLNHYGFCETGPFNPVNSSKQGIYICGAFQGPKDIPETVTQASGAAAMASESLSAARGTLIRSKTYPQEKYINNEKPRVGVFVCRCGINIAGVVDVPHVTEYAKTLPGVVFADEGLYTCSQDSQQKIKEIVKENDLNRLVVASCSPRTHEPLFQETIREAGLNKYLFEMANIRDQCSWVHMEKKEEATEKAKNLVRMAVATVSFLQPLEEQELKINKRGLVVGGGASGMAAALGLADQGFEVLLVEREKKLGGNLSHLHYTIYGGEVQEYMHSMIEKVHNHPSIQVILDGMIVDFTGFKGNFKTGIMSGPGMAYRQIEHGITIVATGGEEYKPCEYLYGEDERVMTQQECEVSITQRKIDPKTINDVVMIQCVGSRIPERPYCSRVCCSAAIKNALKIKEINPKANIYIFYRDIRTYGLLEDYYTQARKAGVMFIRYDLESKPEVTRERENLKVSAWDPFLREHVTLYPQLLVLSSALVPRENDELASLMKLQRTPDNFFLEAHMKLRPVDFATDGIYLCGLAHSPKPLDESLSQAAAAVSRACTLLSHDTITVGGMVAKVDEEKCVACLTCVRVCSYNVPFVNEEGVAQIDAARCQGCGNCAAECPGEAIQLQHCTDEQITAKISSLFNKEAA